MCLTWLASQNLTGKRVLDYGSGSGILAIAALMAGTEHADAVDIDPLAVSACDENAARNLMNGVPLTQRMHACLPYEHTLPDAGYPLVIANILADVIISLADLLQTACAPGGQMLLTGILATQQEKVRAAFASRFSFEVVEQEHWVMLIGRCNQTSNSV